MKVPETKIFLRGVRSISFATTLLFALCGNAIAQETPVAEKEDVSPVQKTAPKMTAEQWAKMSSTDRTAFELRMGLRDYMRANVNGDLVLQEDLRRETQRGILILQREAKTEQEFTQRREQLVLDTLSRFTEMYLLVGEFKESGAMAMLPEDYIRERIDEIVERDFDGDRGRYLTYLRLTGSNPERERARIVNSIIEQNQNYTLYQQIPQEVSPMDVYRAYQQNIDNYKTNERVEFAQIVLYAGAAQSDEAVGKAAKELAQKLKESNDPDAFSEAAKAYSRDEFRVNGGYVGWREIDDLSAPVIEKLKSVKPGETTDVLELRDGSGRLMFAIFKLFDHRDAGVVPLDDVREQIENALRGSALKRVRDEKLADLKERFFVQWY